MNRRRGKRMDEMNDYSIARLDHVRVWVKRRA